MKEKERFQIHYIFEEKAEEVAEELGLVVKYPKNDEIFLDIDTEEQWETMQQRLQDLNQVWNNSLFDRWIIKSRTPSSSGPPHYHVVIGFLKNGEKIKLGNWERVALQFALGSDPIKETLTIYRILSGVKNPSILFEKE